MKIAPSFTDNTLSSPTVENESLPIQIKSALKDRLKQMPGGFTIYKYGKRDHMENFIKNGQVSFAIAETYKDSVLTVGQQDDEIHRKYNPDSENHAILVGSDFQTLKNVFNINVNFPLKGRDGGDLKYYMWCASTKNNKELLSEFAAECCVMIKDAREFFRRLEYICRAAHPTTESQHGCDFYGREIIYCDNNTIPPSSETIDLIFIKDSKYEPQKEFRLIFLIDPAKSLDPRIYFDIGNIEDIAEMVIF